MAIFLEDVAGFKIPGTELDNLGNIHTRQVFAVTFGKRILQKKAYGPVLRHDGVLRRTLSASFHLVSYLHIIHELRESNSCAET